jgi:hypothetical protein
MSFFRRCALRRAGLFRGDPDGRLREELESHFELLVEEKVTKGMTREP